MMAAAAVFLTVNHLCTGTHLVDIFTTDFSVNSTVTAHFFLDFSLFIIRDMLISYYMMR